jgi:galactokinase
MDPKKLTKISEVLPSGLSESTIDQIFELVDSVIQEQVDEKVKILEAKVSAFLRTKVDQLKEQALIELSEENETFRNAKLFESVRSLMTLELTEDDKDSAVNDVSNQYLELQEEHNLVIKQTEQVLLENEKLKNAVKILKSRYDETQNLVESLKEEREQLSEELNESKAALDLDFESSEKAIVYSKSELKEDEAKEFYQVNEFLTEDVIRNTRLLAN